MRDRNLRIYYKNYNQFVVELGQDKVFLFSVRCCCFNFTRSSIKCSMMNQD